MVRVLILIVLILFVIWVCWPFLKTKKQNNIEGTPDKVQNPTQNNFRKPNPKFIATALVILLAIIILLLPKFGINLYALLLKMVPFISSLRGIVHF